MPARKFTDEQLMAALSRIPPFSNLSPAQLVPIVKACELEQYAKGTVICQEGEASHSMYILLSGEVGVFVKGKKVAIRKPIISLGEMGIFTGWQRAATVIADKPLVALKISKENLFRLIQSEHDIGMLLLMTVTQTLSAWLVEKDKLLDEYWKLVERYESVWDDMVESSLKTADSVAPAPEQGGMPHGLEERLRSETRRLERRLMVIEQRIGAFIAELEQNQSIPRKQKLLQEREKAELDAHVLSNLLDQLSKRLANPDKVPSIKFAFGTVELNISFNLYLVVVGITHEERQAKQQMVKAENAGFEEAGIVQLGDTFCIYIAPAETFETAFYFLRIAVGRNFHDAQIMLVK